MYRLTGINRAAYSASKMPAVALFLGMMAYSGGALALPGDAPRIECDALYGAVNSKKAPVIIDVRPRADFEKAHIAGAVSVPFNKLAKEARWPKAKPLVLYCDGKGCPLSYDSAKELIKAGYKNIKVLNGGLREWELREYPVVRAPAVSAPADRVRKNTVFTKPEVSVKGLAEYLNAGGKELTILDTRPANEFEAAHLPGARNIPLEELADRFNSLPKEAEVVVCEGSADRGARAVAALEGAGFPAHYLAGGVMMWSAAGYPVAAGKAYEK